MEKFLVLLLIAVITCAIVEQESLKYTLSHWDDVIVSVNKVINWFKEKGYWDLLVITLKTQGKAVVKAFCEKYFDADVLRLNGYSVDDDLDLTGLDEHRGR